MGRVMLIRDMQAIVALIRSTDQEMLRVCVTVEARDKVLEICSVNRFISGRLQTRHASIGRRALSLVRVPRFLRDV